MALQNVAVEEQCPTIAEILASPIDKYITLVVNNCGYSGTSEDLIVNYVHPFFNVMLQQAKKKILIGVKPILEPSTENIGNQ